MDVGNVARATANVATGGGYGAVQNLAQGNAKGAATSLATGGLNSVDNEILGGSVSNALSSLDPSTAFKNHAHISNPDQAPNVKAPTPAPGTRLPTVAVPTQGPQPTTIAHTQGPQAANINFNPNQAYAPQAVGAQNQLMHQLAMQAQGVGPSVSGMQLRQGQEANLAATMAQLASQRGQPSALAQRTAAQNLANINAQTNQQAAMQRLQEQLQAQGLLGQVSGQAAAQGLQERGQNLDLASQQAQLQQQAALAGYQGDLQTNLAQANINAGQSSQLFQAQQQANAFNGQQQSVYNSLLAQYAQMGLTADQANQQAFLQTQKMIQDAQLGNANIQGQNNALNAQIIGGLISGGSSVLAAKAMPAAAGAGGAAGASGGAAAVAASDRRLKTNVKNGDDKLEKFLMAIGSHSYTYKNPKHGAGEYVSPMAQELEKTDLGKHLVENTPEGKMVHYGHALGMLLSAQSMLMKRVKELESKKAS